MVLDLNGFLFAHMGTSLSKGIQLLTEEQQWLLKAFLVRISIDVSILSKCLVSLASRFTKNWSICISISDW